MDKQPNSITIDLKQVFAFVFGIGVGVLVFFFLIYTDWLKPNYAEDEDLVQSVFEEDGSSVDADLDDIFQDLLEEIEGPQAHGAPAGVDPSTYQDKLDRLCRVYPDYCRVLELPGGLTAQERFFYQSLSVFSMARIDRSLSVENKLADILVRFSLTKNDGRRGFAVSNALTINLGSIDSFREYLEIMIHELAHPVDLGVVVGRAKQLHPNFTEFGKEKFAIDDPSLEFYKLSWQSEKIRKADAEKIDFCSSYGQTNTFEDFAECVNLWKSHNALFRYFASRSDVMKKKYNHMAELFDGKYFFDSESDLMLVKANPDAVFFDTTKISIN